MIFNADFPLILHSDNILLMMQQILQEMDNYCLSLFD